jgi:hypothetical protein
MSEGVTRRVYTQPPSGVKSQNKPKYFTRLGVKYMFIAILMVILIYLSSIVFFLWRNISLTNYTNIDAIFYIAPLHYFALIIVKLILIIMIFISLDKFSAERTEISQKHKKNLSWAKKLFISYIPLLVIVFLLPFFASANSSISGFIIFSSAIFILIIEGFILGFVVLLAVREIANTLQKDLLYIFCMVIILLPIISTSVLLLRLTNVLPSDPNAYQYSQIFYDIYFLIMWTFAAVAYRQLLKSFDIYGRFTPRVSTKFIPHPKPIASYLNSFYSRPKYSIMMVFIVALILCLATGFSGGSDSKYGSDCGSDPCEPGPLINIIDEEDTISGSLREGESKKISIQFGEPILDFCAKLIWKDEKDEPYRDNGPDEFTLTAKVGDKTESVTEKNQHGEECIIDCTWNFGKKPYECDWVNITVTLNTAGDQTGPIGLPISPFTISDTSNEFTLDITYSYIDP